MVFQWFPMVANHWSDDGMVTIHRSGLDNTRLSPPFRGVPPAQLHSTAPQRVSMQELQARQVVVKGDY